MGPDEHIYRRFRFTAALCSGSVVAIAIAVMVGWVRAPHAWPKAVIGRIPTAPSAAIILIILSTAILLYSCATANNRLARWVALGLSVLASAISAVEFGYLLFRLTPPIERILVFSTERVGTHLAREISPIAAANCLLCGLGLCALLLGGERSRIWRSMCGLLGALDAAIGFVAILGYAYGTPWLLGGTVRPVALTAAFEFVLLGVALMSAAGPSAKPLRALVGPSVSARLLRAFLPLSIVVVLIDSFFDNAVSRWVANQALTSAMMAIVTGVIVSLVIIKMSRAIGGSIDEAEVVRSRAEEKIVRLNEELEERVIDRTAELNAVNVELNSLLVKQKFATDRIIKLNQDLNRRAAELDAVNKELESFSYSVSHDLRSPLRAIDGFSQALLEDHSEQLNDEAGDYLRRIRAASQNMAQLIDDMLKLARVTRSEMRLEAVDLSEMANEIIGEYAKSQPDRDVSITIQPGMVVNGDPRMLNILVTNLLDNAWKFTSKHPAAKIEFGSTVKDGRQVYFVRDDGAGFDPRYASKLFGAFQRLHAASEFPGTGIGLATVQRVLNRHGGSVWAEGETEQGATFYFTI